MFMSLEQPNIFPISDITLTWKKALTKTQNNNCKPCRGYFKRILYFMKEFKKSCDQKPLAVRKLHMHTIIISLCMCKQNSISNVVTIISLEGCYRERHFIIISNH